MNQHRAKLNNHHALVLMVLLLFVPIGFPSISVLATPMVCPPLLLPTEEGPSRPAVFHWTGGAGADKEWTNVENWNQNYLPGSNQNDRIIFAGRGDIGSIGCDMSYLEGNIRLEMRTYTKLDVSTELSVTGTYVKMKHNAILNLKPGRGSTVNVPNGYLIATDSFLNLSYGSSLNVGQSVTLMRSELTVVGDDVSLTAGGSLTLTDATMKLTFGATGFRPIVTGSFKSTGSKVTIDASSLIAIPVDGVVTFPLIRFHESSSNSFVIPPENFLITGLPEHVASQVVTSTNSIDLVLSTTGGGQNGLIVDTVLQVDVTKPATTFQGHLKIDPSTAGMVIDGTEFTKEGHETISIALFDLTVAANGHTRIYSRSGTFEPTSVMIQNFPPGLWFELKYEETQISLVVKDLTDYSEYEFSETFVYDNLDVYERQDLSWWSGNSHSWTTIPTWRNARKNKAMTDEEIRILAKNPIVMLGHSPAGFDSNEAGVADTTSRLKAANPNMKVLWYWNSNIAWGTYESFNNFNFDEWIKKDPETGEPLLNNGRRYYYDHSKADMVQWWINSCVDYVTNNPQLDGVFIDSIAWVTEEERPDHYQMVEDLKLALPDDILYVGNALRQRQKNGSREKLNFFDASYMEGWEGRAVNQPMSERLLMSIQVAREALWKGRIVLMNSIPWGCGWPCYIATEEEFEAGADMPLAVFLILAEENAYINYQELALVQDPLWSWDSSHLTHFNLPLGAPLGAPIRIDNIVTRSYEHLTVAVDLDAEIASFDWQP